jgi:hypothetical protein
MVWNPGRLVAYVYSAGNVTLLKTNVDKTFVDLDVSRNGNLLIGVLEYEQFWFERQN